MMGRIADINGQVISGRIPEGSRHAFPDSDIIMEVYFKNLSSEGIATDRLVEDLVNLVEETEHLLLESGVALAEDSREQLLTNLHKVKACSTKLRDQAMAGARATDKIIRRHPYSSLGLVFVTGLGLGFLAGRR